MSLPLAQRAAQAEFDRLVDFVEWKLIEMPLPRLQTIGGQPDLFLYQIGWTGGARRAPIADYQSGRTYDFDNRIRLFLGVAAQLVALNCLLRPLIQRQWAHDVARINRLGWTRSPPGQRPATAPMTNRRLTGLLWAFKWFAIVAALAFVVDILYVFWPYPNGPRGVEPLKATVDREVALIDSLSDDRSASVVTAIATTTYEMCFVWTDLDEMMTRFADPVPLPESDEGMRRLFLANWAVLETAAYGLQLFSMRLGVLVLAMPLFALAAMGAAADGLVTWYRRRTSADRESGFIYHRAKRGLALAVLAVWIAYLVPPVYLDPRWAVVPFVFAVAVITRFAVAFFKKHL